MRFYCRFFNRGLLLSTLLSFAVFAAEEGDQTIVTITGILVDAPECTVADGNTITVDFGDSVVTRQIDGINFREEIKYNLTCKSLSSNAIRLAIRGETAWTADILKTNYPNLGIKLYKGTEALSPGEFINFYYPAQPSLYAVPVTNDASQLSAGAFNGFATMVFEYQ